LVALLGCKKKPTASESAEFAGDSRELARDAYEPRMLYARE